MASTRKPVSPRIQERLREMVAEMREILYGGDGSPEWGTPFVDIEEEAKSVGREFTRLTIEQAVDSQVRHMPKEALVVPGESIPGASRQERSLETESGRVSWEEPRVYLKKSRRDFFPSGPGTPTGSE